MCLVPTAVPNLTALVVGVCIDSLELWSLSAIEMKLH